MGSEQNHFWKTKTLKEMTKAEWESLCDCCGLCCLHNVRFAKTSLINLLAVACMHLDISTCRCLVYGDRFNIEPDCIRLSPFKIRRIKKLPYTCAYRSLFEGRDLEWWHPLVSGDPNTVHNAGISAQDKVVLAVHDHADDLKSF